MRGGVRVGAVSGRDVVGRGGVSIVGNLVEEDVILKGRAGLCVELGVFGEEHFQANSDSILMWKYGKQRRMQQCRDSDRGKNNEINIYKEI